MKYRGDFKRALSVALLISSLLLSARAHAWGDEGHEIVALIAQHYLTPSVRAKVQTLLASDRSALVADSSIATQATWADRYRDSDRDGSQQRYQRSRQWHYVDLQRSSPNLARACFGHAALPAGMAASAGPANACVVDKIDQFEKELQDQATSAAERCLALQFLLHFIGDLHQPLHAISDHDEGGNRKQVLATGMRAASLHHYWDNNFVRELGSEPQAVANALIAAITFTDIKAWSRGSTADWARESFSQAIAQAYDPLPQPANGRYRLSAAYVDNAVNTVRLQLSRAGVRLAAVLNRALK